MIAVGAHLGESTLNPAALPRTLVCELTRAIADGVPLAVSTVEGTPRVVQPVTLAPIGGGNAAAREDDVRAALAAEARLILTTRPTSPHVDVASSIALAAATARSGGATHATVFLLDDLVGDAGSLDLNSGLLQVDPRDVTTWTTQTHPLGDLTGLTVYLDGVGWTTTPQPTPSPAQRVQLTGLYETVLRSAGATVIADAGPRTGPDPAPGLPTVDPVVFPAVPKPPTPDQTCTDTCQVTFHDTGATRFVPDTALLVEPATAKAALTSVAAWLAADPARHITITGTTAGLSATPIATPDLVKLGLARAETIRDLTTAIGASPNQIGTSGAGYLAHPPDLAPNGTLDAVKAALNRTVIITFE